MCTYLCGCEVSTVGKISDCHSGGLVFNPRPRRGLNFWQSSFATGHTVRGQERKAVGLVSRHSIGGHKKNPLTSRKE